MVRAKSAPKTTGRQAAGAAAVQSGLAAGVERAAALLSQSTTCHLGVDVVSVPKWASQLERGGEPLLNRIYTGDELRAAAGRVDRLATRLAAKEAVLKVLGTGIRGIGLRQIEVRTDADGKPSIHLDGAAARRAGKLGLAGVEISLCHEAGFAIAVAAGHTRGSL